jgi:dimethylargininase
LLIGIMHAVSPNIVNCELTFISREPINYELATLQHENYRAFLESCGVKVIRLEENISLPDSCFIEDTVIVLDEVAIICSMGAATRRSEVPVIEKELSKYRDLAHIQLPAMIEGGDVLKVERDLFVGLSSRTNSKGIDELIRLLKPLGYRVHPVEVKESLHLKTACTAINNDTLLVNPNWVELKPFDKFNLIFTPEDEPWSANILRVGKTICLQAGFPKALELVQKFDAVIEVLDISEFHKAEAGLTCLSIIFQNLV